MPVSPNTLEHPQKFPRRVLDVFFVPSSWKTAVSEAVESNLPIATEMLRDHRFYILNETQSREYQKQHFSLVPAVPILVVVDREAATLNLKTGYGFRLCLGVVKNPETAVSLFKWGIQLALMPRTERITRAVSETGHRETFEGLINLLGNGTSHLVEFGAV